MNNKIITCEECKSSQAYLSNICFVRNTKEDDSFYVMIVGCPKHMNQILSKQNLYKLTVEDVTKLK